MCDESEILEARQRIQELEKALETSRQQIEALEKENSQNKKKFQKEKRVSERFRMINAGRRVQSQYHKKHSLEDPLTGLFNRRFVKIEVDRILEIIRREKKFRFICTVLIDIDDFKNVNDTFGHVPGDEILRQFAQQLKKLTRASDITARLGGDEFLVIAITNSNTQAQETMDSLSDRLSCVHCILETSSVDISASVGWHISKSDTYDLAEEMKMADENMYQSKETRKKAAII